MDELEKQNFVPRSKRRNYETVMHLSTPVSKGSWRLWIMLVVFGLVIGVSVYFLFFSEYFKIKNVVIEGMLTEEVGTKIREMISWETDYMILFNENNFAESIEKRWDDIAEVNIEKRWPSELKIEIVPEIPKIVWNSEGKLYVINGTGIVLNNISEEERLQKYNQLPVLGDLSGLPVEKGNKVVSRDFVEFLEAVQTNIVDSVGKEIEAFEVKETTFVLRVRMREGYEILFDVLRDPVQQVEKLNIFVKSGTRVDDYIDLRVPGRVYYR